MYNSHIAEWILALVTTRGRAASIIGDLTEGAATRGAIWFWSGVLRTAASLLCRDIAERPARLAGLAFAGLGVYVGIELIFAGLSGAAFFLAGMTSGATLHLDSIGMEALVCGACGRRFAGSRQDGGALGPRAGTGCVRGVCGIGDDLQPGPDAG